MTDGAYADWVIEFRERAERRAQRAAPPWHLGQALPRAVVRSLQRFQAGEDGDGTSLIAKSARAGDPSYLAAARLFVAEEQHHARVLERLLVNVGATTIGGHWSDIVFVAVRRAGGLRLELLTLMVAEVVALRYYRALRDSGIDPVLTEVAGDILADEHRHVPFHTQRLREFFARMPRPIRRAAALGWWALLLGATVVVAVDHGSALRLLGVGRSRFVVETLTLFRPVAAEVTTGPVPTQGPTSQPANHAGRWDGRDSCGRGRRWSLWRRTGS